MTPKVRYQVFVSSTYEDMRDERQEATQSILEAECFPSGMEMFPASNDSQWELIKRVIEEADYYIVIVGGRYGSMGSSGKSYTEMEYDYAVESGLPILGFVRSDPENIPAKFTERSETGKRKLEQFRNKVLSRTCRQFNDPKDLGMAVMKSLMQEARIRPRTGWIRADQARSTESLERENELLAELADAKQRIAELDRDLRDRALLGEEFDREDLAQGDDQFVFEIIYQATGSVTCVESVSLSWNEIISVIGPSLYGYIQRRPHPTESYSFESALEHKIRAKIIDKTGKRKIEINPSSVDRCVIHLKELGFIRYAETKNEDGEGFRGITLTGEGEQELSRMMVSKRSKE